MQIEEAQLENRTRYVGGFYGQLVSGLLWLISAALAEWSSPRAAITTLVVGGFFIFPMTELLVRVVGARASFSPTNSLWRLGMQVAFVLPPCMLLLYPVGMYRLNWFYPGLMILLGAHYLPFSFLYGMRMFWGLAAVLIGGGYMIAMYLSESFSIGAWYGGFALLVFAGLGWMIAEREWRSRGLRERQ